MSDITDWEGKRRVLNRRRVLLGSTALTVASIASGVPTRKAQAQAQPPAAASNRKPNILFIMGDGIGWFNASDYNRGIMGYQTPNIDRIGKEGAVFNDWYGQQSCTAGRAAFITGQSPIRMGLTKVGLPGADVGFGPMIHCGRTPEALGYATGQFGKNHLGDRTSIFQRIMALTSSLATSTT